MNSEAELLTIIPSLDLEAQRVLLVIARGLLPLVSATDARLRLVGGRAGNTRLNSPGETVVCFPLCVVG